MDKHKLYKKLAIKNDKKIVMLVMDGVGGLPDPKTGLTELEAAYTPNLDKIAKESAGGLTVSILPGITPGSGPAHMSLFGYNPLELEVGRGILSALGIDFPVEKNDIAARINFCTIDKNGLVTDRRAGRIPTDINAKLSKMIEDNVKVDGVEIFFRPEKEHRAAMIIRGEGLSDSLTDTDPQKTGLKPHPVMPSKDNPQAKKTAKIVNNIINQIKEILKNESPANMVLARGFAKHPKMETMEEIYKLKCAAIAVYPMYRGLAKLVGMDVLPAPKDVPGEFELIKKVYNDYDFFFVHIKGTDSSGEDGDYERKKSVIEEVDRLMPQLMELNPDVLIVTGDHSTPSQMKGHSWHPVPTIMRSAYARPDKVEKYGERDLANGLLGTFYALDIMPLAMAKALKFEKFGA